MQLGAELSGQLLVDRIVLVRVEQFPEITFANAEGDGLIVVGEFRHVERVAAERHHRRIALVGFQPLEIAVFENQERSALVFQHRSMVGDDADAFLWIPAIVDEDAGEQSARPSFPDTDGQILVELGEAAGLQDVGEDVRGDVGVPLLDSAHAVRREIGRDKGDHHRHHAGGVDEGEEQPERRKAGGVHHDDLGIGGELVEGVGNRDHQRDRRDDQHQRGNHQAGDAEKGHDGLALARHQVDAAQRLRNPDHARQADQDHRKRPKRRAKDIFVDRPHRYRTIPPRDRNRS